MKNKAEAKRSGVIAATIVFALSGFLAGTQRAQAQWSSSGGNTTTSDNVGIGNTTPRTKLDVSQTWDTPANVKAYAASNALVISSPYNSAAGYAPGIAWVASDIASIRNSAGIFAHFSGSGSYLHFGTTNSYAGLTNDAMVIDPSGNVGIGTTSPTAKLHVYGGSGSSRLLVVGEGAGTGLRNLSLGYDYGADYGWLQSIHDGTAYTPLILQSAGGNVGIGTTSPGEKLDIFGGTFRVQGQNSAPSSGAGVEISYTAGAPGTGYIQSYDRSAAGSDQKLYLSGSQIYLNGNGQGNVGIGKTNPTVALDIVGSVNLTGTINAKYQDVAEWVPSSAQLAAGTVVVLDSTKSNQVTSSTVSYDTRVAGVVSEQPGIALGEKSDGKVLVATTGRVRVKVDASKASIHVGDLLVTSDIPGVAMKSEPVEFAGRKMHLPGTLIGKALEPLEKGKGDILVLLSLQ